MWTTLGSPLLSPRLSAHYYSPHPRPHQCTFTAAALRSILPKLLAGFKALTKKLSKAFKAATFLVASCAPGSDTAVTGTPVPRIARLLALDLTKMGKEHGAEEVRHPQDYDWRSQDSGRRNGTHGIQSQKRDPQD